MPQINFDATNVPPQVGNEPIPEGWYNLAVDASELKPTKSGDGTYYQLQVKVLDGQNAGRIIFDLVNWQNPNPVTVEIGRKRMSAYCHALGVIQLAATEQLHGIPFRGKVGIKIDKSGQYDPSNNIRQIKNINDLSACDAGATSAAPQRMPQLPQLPQLPPGYGGPQAAPQFAPPQQQFAQGPQFAQAPQFAPQQPQFPNQGPPQQPPFAPSQFGAAPPQLPQMPPQAAPQTPPQAPPQLPPQSAPQGDQNVPPWMRGQG